MGNVDSKKSRKRFFRFSMLAMLLLVVAVAVSIVATQRYLEYETSVPIEAAVAGFNVRNQARYDEQVGDSRSPLTTDEVVAFLESDDPLVTDAPSRVAYVFRRIVETKRLPNNAEFDFIAMRSGRELKGWLVGMVVRKTESDGSFTEIYRINIRKIDIDQ